MRPQLFWNVALSMLFCLGIMHIRYHNFVLVSTKIHKFDIGSKKESFFYTYKEYCVFPNIIQASVFYYDRITLVLHISYDRLDPSLIDQVTNWDAPISLAVVFPKNIFIMHSEIACSAQKLLNYTKNNQKVKKHLSVHFILGNNTGCGNNKVFYDSFDFFNKDYCSSTKNSTTPTNEKSRIQQISQYPVNVARNVARKVLHLHGIVTKTKYILIADMDHFFSENFELQMRNMASELLEREPKTVLVYRIFEVSSKVRRYPKTKQELYKLYKTDEAQEFHKPYGGHRIPKLNEWFKRPEISNKTSVQFYRKYDNYQWEPQFVSLTSIPFHDESFFYPFRDNTVLRWEMCRMSYKFAIINDVFMYHRGIKSKNEKSFLQKLRQTSSKRGNIAIKKFNERMDKHFPDTKKKCPKFHA